MNRGSYRFAKRVEQRFPVLFTVAGEAGTFAGELRNISQTGVLLVTARLLEEGMLITLQSAARAPMRLPSFQGKVVRCSRNAEEPTQGGYALSLQNIPLEIDSALHYIIRSRDPRKSGARFSITKISVLGGLLFALPSVLIVGVWSHPAVKNYLIAAFLIIVSVERFLETFFTLRRKGTMAATDDWSISAVSFYYVLMILFCAIESIWFRSSLQISTLVLGALILIASFLLRWWGMKSLGSSWEIHLIGDHQWALPRQQAPLVRYGPYRFMRHPIYTGVILELTAIPLLTNSFCTLIFVLLVNIPLQILRSKLEEKRLLEVLGGQYTLYANECLAFLPWHRSVKHVAQDRRTREVIIDFADRRVRTGSSTFRRRMSL